MDLDKAIQRRHSVKKFKRKKPDWRNILEAIDAARYAPMAGNNFSLKFILVDKKDKIEKLAEASQQEFVSEAHYVVVVCSNPSRTLNAYGEKGEIFYRQQAGAAIQNFLLKIEERKLSTCWIGYFVEDQIKRVLRIPKEVKIEAIFPIGYEFKKHEPKNKIEMDSILYFNEYKKKKMQSENSLDF